MTPDVDATDEYLITYLHHGKKLRRLYWTYPDNRERALKAAHALLMSDGVTDLRVFRRPKTTPWEPVDWRHAIDPEDYP